MRSKKLRFGRSLNGRAEFSMRPDPAVVTVRNSIPPPREKFVTLLPRPGASPSCYNYASYPQPWRFLQQRGYPPLLPACFPGRSLACRLLACFKRIIRCRLRLYYKLFFLINSSRLPRLHTKVFDTAKVLLLLISQSNVQCLKVTCCDITEQCTILQGSLL